MRADDILISDTAPSRAIAVIAGVLIAIACLSQQFKVNRALSICKFGWTCMIGS
jgi:hypothetical protein